MKSNVNNGKGFSTGSLLATVLLIAVSARAEWGDYVQLTVNDLASNDNPALISGVKWNDGGNPPSSEKLYYVKSGWGLMSQNGDNAGVWSFAGGELALAGTLMLRHGDNCTLTIPFLRLLPGSDIYYPGSRTSPLYGRTSVESTAESPAYLRYNRDEWRYAKVLDVTWEGSETAYLSLKNEQSDAQVANEAQRPQGYLRSRATTPDIGEQSVSPVTASCMSTASFRARLSSATVVGF